MKGTIINLYSFLNSKKQRIFDSRHERTRKAKENIIQTFLIRGGSIAVSFLLVPLTVNYVNPTHFGIWVTLSSIVGWLSFFDIGFGNGLRNKFAESVAKGKFEQARIYVSTTYAILIILVSVIIVLFLLINPGLNWSSILNTPTEMARELKLLALIVFAFFCIQFVLQLINTILTANQNPAKASLFSFLGNLGSLVIIYFLTKTTSGNLLYLAVALSITPVLVLAVATVWLFTHDYKRYAPSIKLVRFRYVSDLMKIGLKFFIIQIGALILFQTQNLIITQIFGPQEVTVYNVAFKLFSIVTMVFTIIVTPLWSAFTEAYTNSDYEWIRTTLQKMKRFWYIIIAVSLCILLLSPFLFKIWVGDSVAIPYTLSVSLSIYIIVHSWQTIHVFFLNGIGKIQLQLYLVVITSLANIPIATYLGKKFGLMGITLSSVLLFTVMGIIFAIQTKKILNHTATGIWNK